MGRAMPDVSGMTPTPNYEPRHLRVGNCENGGADGNEGTSAAVRGEYGKGKVFVLARRTDRWPTPLNSDSS